ncbi:hypothetical protein Tco_0228072 [Tanacetum coccineum]
MSERASNPRAGCFFFSDFATLVVALTLLLEEGLGALSDFVLEDRRCLEEWQRIFVNNFMLRIDLMLLTLIFVLLGGPHGKGTLAISRRLVIKEFERENIQSNLQVVALGLNVVLTSVVATAIVRTCSLGTRASSNSLLLFFRYHQYSSTSSVNSFSGFWRKTPHSQLVDKKFNSFSCEGFCEDVRQLILRIDKVKFNHPILNMLL